MQRDAEPEIADAEVPGALSRREMTEDLKRLAALANFGLRLFHLGDASIMVLFWHFGSVGVLSVIAGYLGRYVLRWRRVERPART